MLSLSRCRSGLLRLFVALAFLGAIAEESYAQARWVRPPPVPRVQLWYGGNFAVNECQAIGSFFGAVCLLGADAATAADAACATIGQARTNPPPVCPPGNNCGFAYQCNASGASVGMNASDQWCDTKGTIPGLFSDGHVVATSCTPPDIAYWAPKNLGFCAECLQMRGNPINITTANKVERATDYANAASPLLEISRVYNSGDVSPRTFGYNWAGFYERSLEVRGASRVIANRPDARMFYFELIGAEFLSDFDVPDRLIQLPAGGAAAWRYIERHNEIAEDYDAQGRLLSLRDKQGVGVTLTYSDAGTPPEIAPSAGLLIAVTDQYGRRIAFNYDGAKRLVKAIDPAGGEYQYKYGGPTGCRTPDLPAPMPCRSANLTEVIYPDGKSRIYHYDEAAHMGGGFPRALTGITDENGARFATWDYSAGGAPISSQHAGGANRMSIEYFAGAGNRHQITYFSGDPANPSSVSAMYFVEVKQSIVKVFAIVNSANFGQLQPCPDCGDTGGLAYDPNGNVTRRNDWNGTNKCYGYDTVRVLETRRIEGLPASANCASLIGAPTSPLPAPARMISTQWHADFRLPVQIAEPLRITTLTYGGIDDPNPGNRGNVLTRTVQGTSNANGNLGFAATPVGAPRTWSYTYNANGRVLTVDGPRTDVNDVTAYAYYADAATCSTANGGDTLGCRGQAASITNPLGQATSIAAYTAHGQPTTLVDANGLTTVLAYDARQRLTSRSIGGEVTSYDYDGVGQLTKVTLPDGSFLSYSYDAAHRLTGMQDNLGNRVAYALDLLGNRMKEELFDPSSQLAQTRSRVYNNLNRLVREVGAIGQTTEYAHDNQGNVLSVKDPLNRTTANQYDAFNRLKQVTDPNSGITQYAYNGLDALTQVTDPRSLVTGYTVDGLGNLNQQLSPDTGPTSNTYDAAGNLLTQTDAKGQVTTYTYDALNRVTQITFHDGARQIYAYDQGSNGLGRLSSITERNPADQVTSVIAYAYEPHGRVSSETRTVNGVQYVLGYSYDSAGRLSGLTYPSGRTVTYGFDGLGRVSQVTTVRTGQSQIVVQNVAYHPFGGMKGFTLGNGDTYTRGYDQDGRVASYSLGGQIFAIGYDAASRISFISDLGNPANSNTYDYDSLDRLTSAVLPSTPFAYSYDAVGNRLSKTVGSGTETYSYSTTSNRLATLTPATGSNRTFGFDPNGSTVDDGLNSYVYDTRGRMVQATSVVGATNYQVNALGQRIRKTNTSTDTVFHYDTRGKLIAESDPGGGVYKREFIYLGDTPVMVFQ